MKTKIETITPDIARAMLKTNNQNRQIRQRHVEDLSSEMRAGRFGLTHQGIAFDENGELIDGQHRLLAVIESGCSVQMSVTRGVPVKVNGNGLFAMDVIDNGAKRSVADQLHLMHGVQSAVLVSAALRALTIICLPGVVPKLSVGSAKGILGIYGAELEKAVQLLPKFKAARRASIVAAIAFCAKVAPEVSYQLAKDLELGEGLKAGNPALALRNHLSNTGIPFGYGGNIAAAEWVGNVLLNIINGTKLTRIKRTAIGIDYFKSKQRGNVDKVCAILAR